MTLPATSGGRGPLSGVDGMLTPMAEPLVSHFAVARGVINQRGSLEKSRQWRTNSRRGTLGKGFGGGWFGAYSLGSADTTEVVTRSISLLQIGSTTITDVVVPSTAFHQIAGPGSQVGCVLSADCRHMYFIANHSTGASAGQLPGSGAGGVLRAIGWVVAVICVLIAITGGASVMVFVALAVLGLVAARVGSVAVRGSREKFQRAVNLAVTP